MSLPDRWWRADEPATLVYELAERLRGSVGQERRDAANDALCLYFGNTRNSVNGYMGAVANLTAGDGPPSANVIQWCTDTLVAHIVRNKVRPYFLTDRGDAELQEKAQGMQYAIEALFEDCGMWGREGTKICFDGCLFDGGGMMYTPDYANMRVLGERVFPWDVFVSERESLLGHPRQMLYTQAIDRAVVLNTIAADAKKDVRNAIENAPALPYSQSLRDDWMFDESDITDQILVTTAWHRPSKPVDMESKAEHDGRRVVCIQGATLANEPWPYDYFPIAWFKPLPKPVGYWSRSVPETLAGEQMALNRCNARIDGILHLHARPLLLLWKAAKINPKLVTNAWASILTTAVPPSQALHHVVPQAIPQDLFAQVDRIIRWAEKKLGINEMSIQGTKPPGVDHAPGMQHLAESESVRHTPQFRAWEQMHTEAARIGVDLFRLVAKYGKENGKKLELLWGESDYLKRLEWDKIDIGANRYHLKTWPTNLLPQTPSAKASRVIEFLREGLFTREQALLALEFPDIKSLMGDSIAARENIERRLNKLVKGEGSYEENMPHPYLNLEMAKTIAAERINRLEADGAPDEQIDKMIMFHRDCVQQLRQEQAANVQAQQGVAPQQAPAQQGPVPGVPMQ